MTHILWQMLIPCLLGFLVTFLATPGVIRLMHRLGMVDQPDARRIHSTPTARGGGIAIIAGFYVAGGAMFLLSGIEPRLQPAGAAWLRLLPATIILAITGLLDDRFGIRPSWKLLGQTLAALAAYAMGIRFDRMLGIDLPPALDIAITTFWFLGFVNAFNLIDGLDGLATGLGVVAAVGVSGAMWMRGDVQHVPLALALLGSAVAFLRYNFYPARVFLGDTGSMFLGFTLAALAMTGRAKGTVLVSVVVPLLAIGVPLFDTLLAIWRRTVRQWLARQGAAPGHVSTARLFAPDTEHLHHRLLRAWKSQRQVATYLYLLNAMIAGTGLCAALFHSYTSAIFLSAIVTAGFVIFRHIAHIEIWDTGLAIAHGLSRPSRKRLGMGLYVFADLVVLGLAWVIAEAMRHGSLREVWSDGASVSAILWIGLPFLAIAFCGSYSRIWGMARLTDLVQVLLALGAGLLLAMAVFSVRSKGGLFVPLQMLLTVWGVACTGIGGVRVLPRAIKDVLPQLWAKRHEAGIHAPLRTLVYSACEGCAVFLHAQTMTGLHDIRTRHVVGLIDENRDLHGRHIYGLEVMGGLDLLETLATEHGINELVVARRPDSERLSRLEAISSRLGIRLVYWEAGLTDAGAVLPAGAA